MIVKVVVYGFKSSSSPENQVQDDTADKQDNANNAGLLGYLESVAG